MPSRVFVFGIPSWKGIFIQLSCAALGPDLRIQLTNIICMCTYGKVSHMLFPSPPRRGESLQRHFATHRHTRPGPKDTWTTKTGYHQWPTHKHCLVVGSDCLLVLWLLVCTIRSFVCLLQRGVARFDVSPNGLHSSLSLSSSLQWDSANSMWVPGT